MQDNTWWGYKIFFYFLSGIFQQLFCAVALCNIIFSEIQAPEEQRLLSVFQLFHMK